MPREIFISLTEHDKPIAEALRDAFAQVFGDGLLEVKFSPSRQVGAGIASGEDWFKWIVERVKACHFALILVTPASVNKPWILWEAGAVAGAALAESGGDMRKVRPIVFQVPTELIPSPIRDSKAQYRRGDVAEDFRFMLDEMFDELKADMSAKAVREFGKTRDEAVTEYLRQVDAALLNAPAVVAPAVVEEWCLRLDDLKRENRASEAEHLQNWMDLAFGSDGRPRPLDLRIHSRLAALYMKARNHPRAIAQLKLARQLAPRDIFVLRQLGRALLDHGEHEQAREVLDRIEQLDKNAVVHNAECAALAARWHRSAGDLARADAVLAGALAANPRSYYLATVLAEVRAEDGRLDDAGRAYRQVLEIIDKLGEDSVWVRGSQANARFFLGEDEAALQLLGEIAARKPDAGTWASIERGLEEVAKRVPQGPARLLQLLSQARGAAA
jgi:tetratricopeptide (TPR) repeat protein